MVGTRPAFCELLGAQGRRAPGDHHRPAVGGQAARELAGRTLSLGGDTAGQHHLDVGLGGIAHRAPAARGKDGEHRFAVGLAHLAAGKRGVNARRFAPVPEVSAPAHTRRLAPAAYVVTGVGASSTTQFHSPSLELSRRR